MAALQKAYMLVLAWSLVSVIMSSYGHDMSVDARNIYYGSST